MSEQKENSVEKRVINIIRKKLDKIVSLEDNLLSLELDSLDAADLIMRLEDEFGIKIPNEDEKKIYPGFYSCESEAGRYQDYATIGEVVDYIQRRLDNSAQSSVKPSTQPATAA